MKCWCAFSFCFYLLICLLLVNCSLFYVLLLIDWFVYLFISIIFFYLKNSNYCFIAFYVQLSPSFAYIYFFLVLIVFTYFLYCYWPRFTRFDVFISPIYFSSCQFFLRNISWISNFITIYLFIFFGGGRLVCLHIFVYPFFLPFFFPQSEESTLISVCVCRNHSRVPFSFPLSRRLQQIFRACDLSHGSISLPNFALFFLSLLHHLFPSVPFLITSSFFLSVFVWAILHYRLLRFLFLFF